MTDTFLELIKNIFQLNFLKTKQDSYKNCQNFHNYMCEKIRCGLLWIPTFTRTRIDFGSILTAAHGARTVKLKSFCFSYANTHYWATTYCKYKLRNSCLWPKLSLLSISCRIKCLFTFWKTIWKIREMSFENNPSFREPEDTARNKWREHVERYEFDLSNKTTQK